jgi:uncharacterized protein YbaR (Trm112 family)
MPVAHNLARMLDLIVCPACHGPLVPADQNNVLCCKACKRKYGVKDGIPVLIPQRAIS